MERIDAVGRSAPSARPPRVVFLFDWKPLVAAGEESFPGELLALAGAQNAVRGGGKYPKLGVEGLAALDPDVIVDGSGHGDGSLDAAAADPALRAVRAVRDGRIRKLTSTAALRPGPRLGEGVEELARLVRDGSAAASP
jgi:iron complex transport system substrate-binding protein